VKIYFSAIKNKIIVVRKMIRGKVKERAKNLYFFMQGCLLKEKYKYHRQHFVTFMPAMTNVSSLPVMAIYCMRLPRFARNDNFNSPR